MSEDKPLDAFRRAVGLAGGQTALADKLTACTGLSVKQPQVWNWLNREKRVPVDYVLGVEKITGVSRHELRPDIYPIEDFSDESEEGVQP